MIHSYPSPIFCNSTLHHSVHFYPIAHHIYLLFLSAQVRSHSLFCSQSLYTLSCPFQRQIWFINQDWDASKGPELVFAELMPSPVLRQSLGFPTAHHDFLRYMDFLTISYSMRLPYAPHSPQPSSHIGLNVSQKLLRAFTSSSGRWDVQGFNEEIDRLQEGKCEIRSFWLNPISMPCPAESLVTAEAISLESHQNDMSSMQGTHRAGEITQWVKCLIHKHEDFPSDLQHPRKQ